MKRTLCAAIFLLGINAVSAEQQTLLGGGLVNGGFGGPEVKFTQIKDEFAVLTGGYGAWLINHSFFLGGGGCGVVNQVKVREISDDTTQFLGMGYGGPQLGYIFSPNSLVHFSASSLIGGGGLNFQNRPKNSFAVEHDTQVYTNDDAFFVLEPTVRAELNIVSFFRLALGASYRYVNGLENTEITDSDLSGPSASINLMFGRF